MNSITADRYFYIVGRFLLGLYFLLPGLAKVFLFQDNLDVVILREVPFPTFSLSLVAIAQIFFGTMLMLGKYVHMGALVLAVVTLLINFYIHDFWNFGICLVTLTKHCPKLCKKFRDICRILNSSSTIILVCARKNN